MEVQRGHLKSEQETQAAGLSGLGGSWMKRAVSLPLAGKSREGGRGPKTMS